MRVLIYTIFALFIICSKVLCSPLTGVVEKENFYQNKLNRIVDNLSGNPVKNARVSIPSRGISTVTDSNGYFKMDADINGPVILSVNAEGYRPFSLTATREMFGKPFTLGISKQKLNEIVIDSSLYHLGDDSFSESSANADDFKLGSAGPSITKRFYVSALKPGQQAFIRIGSIIGLDTETAKSLRQNKIKFAASSPAQVYVNSQKIGELKINGDNQSIYFSTGLLRENAQNEVRIETGRNLSRYDYVDYDDIEIMNLILEMR